MYCVCVSLFDVKFSQSTKHNFDTFSCHFAYIDERENYRSRRPKETAAAGY